MVAKALATLIFFLILLITAYIFIGAVDIRSKFFSFSLPLSPPSDLPLCKNGPIRVYMYNLPHRFNFGMIDRTGDPVDENLPPWPGQSGLKKQHSVEYWMMASLLYERGEKETEERGAVRVSDPETAEVFFVPFFSSLSFNTHGHNMTDPETEIDRQLQIDLLEILRKSKYWQQSEGHDHVIPVHHPNAFRFLRDQVNASILLVADFGRITKNVSFLSKDVVAPYVHVVDSYVDDNTADPFESRSTLLFFRGRTVRKDDGIVRAKLAKILVGHKDVHFEESIATEDGIKTSAQGMRSSKFCLNPAGDTPSSCRLFDAIVSHCVPVIVSDRIELPFESEIDYRDFAVFFSVQEALRPNYMVEQLRKISKKRWTEMWWRLKKISHHYEYQYPPKRDDAVNMIWKQVRHRLPAARLAMHRNRRLKIPDWWSRR